MNSIVPNFFDCCLQQLEIRNDEEDENYLYSCEEEYFDMLERAADMNGE